MEKESNILDLNYRYSDEPLAIGKIFMIDSCRIEEYQIDDEEGEYIRPYIQLDNKKEDMLFIVKYIGNGYFQEMLTGEKIRAGHFLIEENFEDDNNIKYYNDMLPIEFNDAIAKDYHSVQRYLNDLNDFKNIINECPLAYTYDRLVHDEIAIDNNSKLLYLKYSDEERINTMKALKNHALESRDKVLLRIDQTIKKLNSAQDIVDLAYLENQIYDFDHNNNIGRRK